MVRASGCSQTVSSQLPAGSVWHHMLWSLPMSIFAAGCLCAITVVAGPCVQRDAPVVWHPIFWHQSWLLSFSVAGSSESDGSPTFNPSATHCIEVFMPCIMLTSSAAAVAAVTNRCFRPCSRLFCYLCCGGRLRAQREGTPSRSDGSTKIRSSQMRGT